MCLNWFVILFQTNVDPAAYIDIEICDRLINRQFDVLGGSYTHSSGEVNVSVDGSTGCQTLSFPHCFSSLVLPSMSS